MSMTPQKMLEYMGKQGRGLHRLPDLGLIFVHQKFLLKAPAWADRLERQEGFFLPFYLLQTDGGTIGLTTDFGVGAPALALAMELFIAAGIKRFLSVGSCGALGPGAKTGETHVAESALIDEGLSLHYEKVWGAEVFAGQDLISHWENFTQRLKGSVDLPSISKVVTTDGPYRLNLQKKEKLLNQGARLVDMETSALYSLAQVHQVQALSLLTVSDRVDEKGWQPEFHFKAHRQGQLRALNFATEFLSHLAKVKS